MRCSRVRSWMAMLLTAGVLAGVGLVSTALAANCGGSVPCQCGDTVQSSITLSQNLGVCLGLGLRVRPGVTLDCNGHTITGSNLPGAWYGILVDTATNAEVKNCRVTGFRRAIRVRGGQGNHITGNEVFGNRYGIELAGQTIGNVVAGNSVYRNRDEGIHIGAGSNNNEIRQNTVTKNKREGIYVLSSSGCQVILNTITTTDNAGILVKHSANTYVAQNRVLAGPILVRGDSTDNVFEANHLRGNGYFFKAYQDSTGVWTFPHNNTVLGGIVENTATCLRFAGAYDNRVDGLRLDSTCDPPALWTLGGQASTGNVINTLPYP